MNAFLSPPTSHCHAPQSDSVPAIQLKNEIKPRAATTDESTSTIIHSALRIYPLSAAGQLRKNESLMLMIQRQRTTETVDADGRLPEKLRKTHRDEGFTLHEDNKLITFTKKTSLYILKQNKHWFADGTFKVCPDDYYPLFTLDAMMTNAITPLVYGLLIGKSAEDYNLFFEKVLKQDNFQPESNMTDFETGTIKSVKDMLPNILHKAVCRQVQRKGLTTKYSEDEFFRLYVKQLIALAFVLLDQIITGLVLICDQFDDDADDLLEYFEKKCIGELKSRGTGRKKPQLDHRL
ncbi:unnamed protein product [Rotaria magnacalcarata]|uniref:MULE transposase domain-containing protein n=1 Tax=Rotaria magnacalcarata TaxID=392030 RepID=A0A816NBH1_9BILA|nr:unnamed protein product [Rotaria magnacalcarata]